MSVKAYRKKPVVVSAVQWDGTNDHEIMGFTSSNFSALDDDDRKNCADPDATAEVFDELHSTWVLVYTGDYIIRGIKGEFYPCRNDVFLATYEVILPT